jgi:hypothetical protein
VQEGAVQPLARLLVAEHLMAAAAGAIEQFSLGPLERTERQLVLSG